MIAGGEMETEEDVLFLGMRAVADRCVGWWEWSSDQDVLRWLWHFPWLPRAISRAWISPLGPCLLRLWSLFHWNTAYSGSLTDRNHLGSPFMKITLRTLPLLSLWISRITKSWTSTHTTYIPSLLKGWFCTFCPVFWQTLGHISGVVPQSPFYVSSGNHLIRAHG